MSKKVYSMYLKKWVEVSDDNEFISVSDTVYGENETPIEKREDETSMQAYNRMVGRAIMHLD